MSDTPKSERLQPRKLTARSNVERQPRRTLYYRAQVPNAQWLHAACQVVIPPPANDNTSITPLSVTGTDATSTP